MNDGSEVAERYGYGEPSTNSTNYESQKENEKRQSYSSQRDQEKYEYNEAPRSAIFRRLIDVNDITGEMTFFKDGNDNYTFVPENYGREGWTNLCIVEVDPETKNHVVLDEKSLYDGETLKSFTGKVITQSLVEKMCGKKPGSSEGKKEIYVKCDLRDFLPLQIVKKPMTDGDITALQMAIDLSEAAMETQGFNLCKTRSKPIVVGPAVIELVPIPDGCPQRITFPDYYIKIGEFSVKIIIAHMEEPDLEGKFRIHSINNYLYTMSKSKADIFITKDAKSQRVQLQDKSNTTLHRNLKRRTYAKVNDVVYFYKSTDTTREYPLTGTVINVVTTEDVKNKTKIYKYDIKYTDEETGEHTEPGVSQLYERDTEAEKAEKIRDREAEIAEKAGSKDGGKKIEEVYDENNERQIEGKKHEEIAYLFTNL